MDRVSDLRTLDDPTDLTALALLGWNVLPHGYNSFRGMGMAVLRGEEIARPEPLPGRPELLLYRPDPGASDVTDPLGADFPYRLAGWGYLGSYDFARHPTGAGPCFRRSDWFVHERGIHDLQTLGFVPVPPREDFHGQDPGNEPFAPFPPGFPHPRFWDMHLWLGAEGVPTVSMLNPGTPIPGIDPRAGVSFFYPPASARPDQASPKTQRRRCLARRSPIGRRGIGRIRLRYTRSRLLRLPVRPLRRTRYSYRYCVRGRSGRVSAVFSRRSRRGGVELVTTTARGHGNRRVSVRTRTSAFRRAYPRRRRVASGLFRAEPRSPRLFGIRRGRVRFIAVAGRRLLSSERRLRRALRRAGVRR